MDSFCFPIQLKDATSSSPLTTWIWRKTRMTAATPCMEQLWQFIRKVMQATRYHRSGKLSSILAQQIHVTNSLYKYNIIHQLFLIFCVLTHWWQYYFLYFLLLELKRLETLDPSPTYPRQYLLQKNVKMHHLKLPCPKFPTFALITLGFKEYAWLLAKKKVYTVIYLSGQHIIPSSAKFYQSQEYPHPL